jgi:spore germination protein GerM
MTGVVPPPTTSARAWWFGAAAGLVLVALGVALVYAFLPRFLDAPAGEPAPPAATGPAAPAEAQRTINATLYYLSPGRLELVPVTRDVPFAESPADQARRIVEAQVAAPPDGQVSTIPAGTTVRAVFLAGGGRAYVDLGGAIVSGHAGGTLNETLTVYAIVHAVTTNLPDVTAVQILVDGKEVDSLTGHLDLRSPLGPSPRWIQPRGQ